MYEKWLYMMAMAILVAAGALSFLFWTRRTLEATALLTLLTLAALYVGFRRDTYLPFLGETVLPCSLLEEQTPPHADAQVMISGVEPGAKVLFWASEPETNGLAKIKDWRRAYLTFANAGVTTADEAGHAILRVRTPQPYTVPLKGRIESHVHWRVCRDGGMIGPVETTMIPQ
jgi:hypothetical protein